jgi:diguanylate cyclase (GGDEF)-like protein
VRLRRPNLLVSFGVLSLVPLVALGLALSTTLKHVIRDRVVKSTRDEASYVTGVALPAYIPASQLDKGLSNRSLGMLRAGLANSATVGHVTEAVIRNDKGTVVFDTNAKRIGTAGPVPNEAAQALGGTTVSRVTHLNGSKVMEVDVPLVYFGHFTPAGVATLYFPYSGIERSIAKDTRELYLILLGGLLLLYALLFPIVARAAGKLRKHAAVQEHLASHDHLTGLANTFLFRQELEKALERRASFVAILVVDVDRFKSVNDRLGHRNGDVVLKIVGERLRDSLRLGDAVARIGGDEFAVVLPDGGCREAELIACRILDSLGEPLLIEGQTLRPTASIGVALAPDDGTTLDELLHAADLAMYAVKASGGGFRFADSQPEPGPRPLSLHGAQPS